MCTLQKLYIQHIVYINIRFPFASGRTEQQVTERQSKRNNGGVIDGLLTWCSGNKRRQFHYAGRDFGIDIALNCLLYTL